METLQDFLTEFESIIVEEGIKKNIFSTKRKVSISPGKLKNTIFGRVVGYIINTSFPMAIDYYGHYKKSRGFFELISMKNKESKKYISSVKIPVVHFTSIKDRHINALTKSDPLFLGKFFMYKQQLIQLRWGTNEKK